MKKSVRNAALVVALALTAAAYFDDAEARIGPHECDEFCSPEGSEAGCIDRSGPVWRRVICTCIQGRYVC